MLFKNGFNKFLEINDNDKDLTKQGLKSLLECILKIIFTLLGIKVKDKNVLFDYCGDHPAWHKEGYFPVEKYLVYLRIHRIIKLEHRHLFKNGIDIKWNMMFLCPNCHRKLHNAQEHVVKELSIKIYNRINKKLGLKTVFLWML